MPADQGDIAIDRPFVILLQQVLPSRTTLCQSVVRVSHEPTFTPAGHALQAGAVAHHGKVKFAAVGAGVTFVALQTGGAGVWNLLGILDLVVAVGIGGLSSALVSGVAGKVTTGPMVQLPLALI